MITGHLISQRGGVGSKAGENLVLKSGTGNRDGSRTQSVALTKLEGAKLYRVYDLEARKGKAVGSILFLNLSTGNMTEAGGNHWQSRLLVGRQKMCLGPNPVNMTWFANEAFVGVIMLKLSGLAPPGCMGAFESIP